MTSLPILNLPFLVQLQLIPQIELIDLIELSFRHRAFKRMMSFCKYKVENLTWTISTEDPTNWKVRIGELSFGIAPKFSSFFKIYEKAKIGGIPITYRKTHTTQSKFFDFICQDPFQLFKALEQHLRLILQVPTDVFEAISISSTYFEQCFLWKSAQIVHKFDCSPFIGRIYCPFALSLGTVDKTFLAHLPLFKIEVKKDEFIGKKLEEDFGVSRKDYMTSKYRHAFIESKHTEPIKTINFVKLWVDGNFEHLDGFYFNNFSGAITWNGLFETVNTCLVPFRPTSKRNWQYKNEWCLLRKDGKLARLYFYECHLWILLDWE